MVFKTVPFDRFEKTFIVAFQREHRDHTSDEDHARDDEEGWLVADLITERAQRGRENHVAELRRQLECHQVQGCGERLVEVDSEVLENSQDAQRNLKRVQHLRDTDQHRAGKRGAQENTDEHHADTQQQRIAGVQS